MKTKISLVTISGKAYYHLVKELKKRKIQFLSLIPGETVPPSISVTITTKEEKSKVNHPTVLVYDYNLNPSDIVDEAIRIIHEKEIYKKLVIGIDPGKNFGIAILVDDEILNKDEKPNMEMTIQSVLSNIKKYPAGIKKIKIGNGIPELAEKLASRLSIALPKKTIIEFVSETGTTNRRGKNGKKKLKNSDSAVIIAERNGFTNLRVRKI